MGCEACIKISTQPSNVDMQLVLDSAVTCERDALHNESWTHSGFRVLKACPEAHLCDDQQRQVQPVHQQVCDAVLDKLLGALHVPLNQELLQASCDHILDQQAVVTPHCLNAFAVHLVMLVWVGPQQPSVPLLVDQQVGIIHLRFTAMASHQR